MKDLNDNKTADMFVKPPLTNAERQRAYRQRQKQQDGQRIDMYIPNDSYDKLRELTMYHKMTIKDLLVTMIDSNYSKTFNVK